MSGLILIMTGMSALSVCILVISHHHHQVVHRRERMRSLYSLEPELCVQDWSYLLSLPKLADAVIISTQDKDHKVHRYRIKIRWWWVVHGASGKNQDISELPLKLVNSIFKLLSSLNHI